ncbi:MAG: hypothetical protein HYZ45_03340 [Burkholderiales bacterium]|nr:hypothetical protein [Burkholderiales bacterium]
MKSIKNFSIRDFGKVALSALSLLSMLALNHSAYAGISDGYVPPSGKQGVADFYYDGTASYQNARYAFFNSKGIKTKIYNIWWKDLESRAADFPSKTNLYNFI